MRLCVAGAYGAFGQKHLDALAQIENVEVTSVMGPTKERIEALAEERGIGHAGTTIEDCIARDDVDAVILSTPTQMHADQAIACMDAGKHVLIEIPMADSLADSQRVVDKKNETGLVCMAGQVRRFNPSHQWIKNKIDAGELKIQQMDVQTYFSGAPTPTRRARRGLGPITCFGTTPVTLSICFSTRPVARRSKPLACRAPYITIWALRWIWRSA